VVGIVLAAVVAVGVVVAGVLATVGWLVLHGNGPDDDEVVQVDAVVELAPVAEGTRVHLTLTPLNGARAPGRVVTDALDDGFTIDDPPFSGHDVTGLTATGVELRWVDVTPLRRNGSSFELDASVPLAHGRRVVIVQGLGPYLQVRSLTAKAPEGAVTSCLVTYSDSARRAHRVTPCEAAAVMQPELPRPAVATVSQGEQEMRFELGTP
jgi:hypothetical protein